MRFSRPRDEIYVGRDGLFKYSKKLSTTSHTTLSMGPSRWKEIELYNIRECSINREIDP